MSDMEKGKHWDDVHGDPLDIGIEREPSPWPDPEDQLGERYTSYPVIYISGDAYLSASEAREAADHLSLLADALDKTQAQTP